MSAPAGYIDWAMVPTCERDRQSNGRELSFDGLDRLPAIQWKLHIVRQKSARTHSSARKIIRDSAKYLENILN